MDVEGAQAWSLICTNGNASLGGVDTHFMRPERFDDNFDTIMDCLSEECNDFATEFFEKNITGGFPLPKVAGLPSFWKRCLALWSCEFLMIEMAQVDLAHRRMGIGKHMVETVLAEAKKRHATLAFVRPSQVTHDLESSESLLNIGKSKSEKEAIFDANIERAIKFWRAMGFYRMGRSEWFCYFMDSTDWARETAEKHDLDP